MMVNTFLAIAEWQRNGQAAFVINVILNQNRANRGINSSICPGMVVTTG